MKVRLDHHPSYWGKIKNVPNHQPDDDDDDDDDIQSAPVATKPSASAWRVVNQWGSRIVLVLRTWKPPTSIYFKPLNAINSLLNAINSSKIGKQLWIRIYHYNQDILAILSVIWFNMDGNYWVSWGKAYNKPSKFKVCEIRCSTFNWDGVKCYKMTAQKVSSWEALSH